MAVVRGPFPHGLTREQVDFLVTACSLLSGLVSSVVDADRAGRQQKQFGAVSEVASALSQAEHLDDVLPGAGDLRGTDLRVPVGVALPRRRRTRQCRRGRAQPLPVQPYQRVPAGPVLQRCRGRPQPSAGHHPGAGPEPSAHPPSRRLCNRQSGSASRHAGVVRAGPRLLALHVPDLVQGPGAGHHDVRVLDSAIIRSGGDGLPARPGDPGERDDQGADPPAGTAGHDSAGDGARATGGGDRPARSPSSSR